MEITEEDKDFTVTLNDGTTRVIKGKVITTTDGVDEEGNPKISVEIKVPVTDVNAVPGEVS